MASDDTNIEDLADYVVMLLRCEECGVESEDSTKPTPMQAATEFDGQGWRFKNRKVLCFDCAEKD